MKQADKPARLVFGSRVRRRCFMEQFSTLFRSKDKQPVSYLIVDDSVFARKNLSKIVEGFGGKVAGEAGDGMTAIAEYDRVHPDLVLMDITMPQMEGINAADAVLSETLQSTAKIGDVSMEEETYRRRGIAAMITIVGDIEGRVIFDLDPPTAAKIAGHFAGGEVEVTDDIVRETVCELANQVIGNAVTTL